MEDFRHEDELAFAVGAAKRRVETCKARVDQVRVRKAELEPLVKSQRQVVREAKKGLQKAMDMMKKWKKAVARMRKDVR